MTLHFGNCLDLLPHLADNSVDMVLTDLPYGTTRNAWDSLIDLDRLWPELLRVTKPKAAIVMTAQMPFTATLVLSAPKRARLRHHWIWEKAQPTGHLNARRAPMKAHEDVLVFATGQPPYFPQKTENHDRKVSSAHHKRNSHFSSNYGKYVVKGYDSTERYPRSVIQFPTDKQKSTIHPTQKPVALFEYFIRTYSQEGDVVLDVAAGSATTEIAARNTCRRAICFEKDPGYYGLASDRIAA
mgnify:CR=1 FL=1